MPVPGNPIDRRQVLKALAAIPVLASPLNVPQRQRRPRSSDAQAAPASDVRRRQPHARQALIGVL
jgi:hypothetical protein